MGGTRTETRTSLGAELAGVCRRAAIGTYVHSGFEDTPPLAHSLTACSLCSRQDSPPVLRRLPKPCFVLKFRDVSYRKVFVNVCMLEDFDGVVAALEDATDTDSRHGQLGDVDVDVDVDVERINVADRMIVSKTSTSCVDRRNRPCVVFQCGCAADLLARIESGVGVCGYDGCDGVQRGFLVRLVEGVQKIPIVL